VTKVEVSKEGMTEDQKIRAFLLGPVGTAMGANWLNRGGKTRTSRRKKEKIAFQHDCLRASTQREIRKPDTMSGVLAWYPTPMSGMCALAH
jgi:hypothetical protein